MRLAAELALVIILSAPLGTANQSGAAEPPEAMVRARHAYELARAGDTASAITELQDACRLAPRNALYRSALGGIYERAGKLEDAVAAFSEAVKLDPANPKLAGHLESVSLDWGAALAREKRFRAGLAHARATADRFPQSAAAFLMLGLFETRNQQNLAAVAAYQRALQLDPDSADASVGLAVAQSSAGLVNEAASTLEAGLQKFPRDAMHRQAYGVLLVKMTESGAASPERAEKMLESALALDPSLAEAHYQLGSLALARGDANAALQHFGTAGHNGLDDSRIHYAMARALRRLSRNDEAEQQMELFRRRKQAESVQP